MKTFAAILALAFAFACALPSDAQVYTGTALQNSAGNVARVVPFAPVTVCLATDTAVPCTQKALTFTDETLVTQCSATGGNGAPLGGTGCNNPGIADANGNFTFFATPGVYRVCTFAQNYQCVKVSTGGSGGSSFACGTTNNPGIPLWNGTACLIDINATLDGNGNLSLVSVNASGNVTAQGTVSGSRVATSGTGGILDLQFQTPPATVPATHAYVIGNSITGLLDCFVGVVSPTHCISSVQLLGSGAVSLPTSAVTSGACSSVVTLTATGATTGSHIVATPAADPTGVTGYGPSASGSVSVQAYVTLNTANFKVCNNTAGTITPGALTLNAVVF
jgi:hypothetical protein